MIGLLAFGGNVPHNGLSPDKTIIKAIDQLFQDGVQVLQISKFYHTPCFPVGAGPDFVNAAAKVSFDGTAAELLNICHKTERTFGRERHVRWSARTLDIDLLAVDDLTLPDRNTVESWISADDEVQRTQAPAEMILPHPRLQDRAFVLVPLQDIAPDWVHPILGKSVRELVTALPEVEKQAISLI